MIAIFNDSYSAHSILAFPIKFRLSTQKLSLVNKVGVEKSRSDIFRLFLVLLILSFKCGPPF